MRKSHAIVKFTFLLAASLPLFGYPAFAQSLGDWANTGLTWSFLSHDINNQNCNEDAKTFSACYRALASPVATVDRLLIPSELKSSFFVKKVVMEFGPLSVVELAQPAFQRTSEDETESLRKAFEKKEVRSLARIFKTENHAVDWNSALDKVEQAYVPPDLSEAAKTGAAYNEYLNLKFDPHTRVVPGESLERQQLAEDNSVVSLGLGLKARVRHLSISSIFPNSPAATAGLHRKDLILSVNHKALPAADEDQLKSAMDSLRGLEGTRLELEILRGKTKMNLTATLKHFDVPLVKSRALTDSGQRVGVIQFEDFLSDNLCKKVEIAVGQLRADGARGLIIDLRGNYGGQIDEAACIAGLFVGQKIILQQRDLNGKPVETVNGPVAAKFRGMPIVILQDGLSASASEILAGALQDYRAAWVVGEQSYGKGTYQIVNPHPSMPKLELMKTEGRFFRPSGLTNQVVGVTPDFYVPWKINATAAELRVAREGDTFTNALPPIGRRWVQPRPLDASQIAMCAKQHGRALENFRADRDVSFAADYQLLVAEDLLACSIASAK